MKSSLYGRTADVLMVVLLFCLLGSFSLIEARDLRDEIASLPGIGLLMSTRESKPWEDITRQQKFGGLKLQATAEKHSQEMYGSPLGKVGVEVVRRSLKENTMVEVDPMAHSPGIGHHVPASATDSDP